MSAGWMMTPAARRPEGMAERFEMRRASAWSLRVQGQALALVLERAPLPGGAELTELVMGLPHVKFPFDFKDGVERFRHHRGAAEELRLRIDARVLLDWLHQASGGRITGQAVDEQLVLAGKTAEGTRWTMRGRVIPDPSESPAQGGAVVGDASVEPVLQLSLFGMRAYGATQRPWPALAGEVLDLLPAGLVAERGLTTARLKVARPAVAWALAGLGWKLPELGALRAVGVELREGRFEARFVAAGREQAGLVVATPEGWSETQAQGGFERFIEDLELKRHHGQVDRLLGAGAVREALAEVYRALGGAPRPGFLAERLIGICASQPILYDEGERVCRGLLAVAPRWEPAAVGLVAIALGRGRQEEAAVHLERLVADLDERQEREDASAADLTLAELLRESAPDAARAALERVLERAPDHEEALGALIELAERGGEPQAVVPLYKRLLFAARSQARTREAGLRLAELALARREPEDARVLLQVVLQAAPGDLEAQLMLAGLERDSGHGGTALGILEDALRGTAPTDGRALTRVVLALGELLLGTLADPARARRVLWRVAEVAEVDAAEALGLAKLALRAHEPSLALRFAERVRADRAGWADAQVVRAEALLAQRDPDGALDVVVAVLGHEPDHEGALGLLEAAAPDPARREWLVHELAATARRVEAGEPRARILHRVASLFESVGLAWDALLPLRNAVFEAPESARLEARAAHLMALQARFGLWAEHQTVGRLRLQRLQELGLAGAQAVLAQVGLLTELGRVALEELGNLPEAIEFFEEATRLSPRSVGAQELFARALGAALGRGERQAAETLSGVLHRLESLRSEPAGRDAARFELAEVQLGVLGAVGAARATLARVEVREGAAWARWAAWAGVPEVGGAAGGPQEVLVERGEAVSAEVAVEVERAVGAADRGAVEEAVGLLRAVLRRDPKQAVARELLEVLGAALEEVGVESYDDANLPKTGSIHEQHESWSAHQVQERQGEAAASGAGERSAELSIVTRLREHRRMNAKTERHEWTDRWGGEPARSGLDAERPRAGEQRPGELDREPSDLANERKSKLNLIERDDRSGERAEARGGELGRSGLEAERPQAGERRPGELDRELSDIANERKSKSDFDGSEHHQEDLGGRSAGLERVADGVGGASSGGALGGERAGGAHEAGADEERRAAALARAAWTLGMAGEAEGAGSGAGERVVGEAEGAGLGAGERVAGEAEAWSAGRGARRDADAGEEAGLAGTPRPSRVQAMLAEARALDAAEEAGDALSTAGGGLSAAVVEKMEEGDRIDQAIAQATEAYFAGALGEARAALEAALAIDPDVVAALELLQEVLSGLGAHEERAATLERLVTTVFDVEAQWSYLALLVESYAASGRAGAAQGARARLLAARPVEARAAPEARELVAALEEAGDAEALGWAAELRERYAAWWEPEQGAEERGAEGLLAQARAAFEAEAWAEARAALEEVLAGDPDAPEALELAVRVALAEGRLPEARVMARRLLPALLEGPTREWMASVAGA